MNKSFKVLLIIFISYLYVSCFKETSVPVVSDFDIEVVNNDYSVPVTIRVTNKSIGADLYEWTFEGGEPAQSTQVTPEDIIYQTSGEYILRLEAWNTSEHKVKELSIRLDSAIHAEFTYDVLINHFSPVEVALVNTGYGGSHYYWEFEGGVPQTYEGRIPPPIVFTEPGLHKINLQVSNARERVEFADTLFVLPALSVDFTWQPSKDDYDMEAPLEMDVAAQCVSALSYSWKVTGGQIENDSSVNTKIHFDKAGEYEIILEATNNKETKRISKTIKISENSNLYKIADLKFGITTALNTIGGYYFSRNRDILTTDEITSQNGSSIDLVFWGLIDFVQCCFLSPDAATSKALPSIPGARHTWVINNPEMLTSNQFDKMENDSLLRRFSIKEASEVCTDFYFSGADVPQIILFETADHRKGAIKIKKFVYDGADSYILTDIKIQKKDIGF